MTLRKIIKRTAKNLRKSADNFAWADLIRMAEVGILCTTYDEIMALDAALSTRVDLCVALPRAKQAGVEFLAALRVPEGKAVSVRLDSASPREAEWVEAWWQARHQQESE